MEIARTLRAQADELDEMIRSHNAYEEKRTLSALDIAHRLCDEGQSDHDALAAAADAMGVDPAALRFVWNLNGHRMKAEQRRWLMVRINDLTAAGLKDGEIARILSIHPGSIPRIRRVMRSRQER